LYVLHEEVIGIHPDRSGGVFESRHSQRAGLRMVWRSPGSLAADVIDDGSVLPSLIRDFKDVGYLRRSATAHSTRSPRPRLPSHQRAVLLEPYFYFRIVGRSRTGDHQFGVSFVKHLHRLSGLLSQTRCGDVPFVGSKLAAESAADVILLNSNVRCRYIER